MHRMQGDLAPNGQTIARAGFMYPALSDGGPGMSLAPSLPLYQRGSNLKPEHLEFFDTLQRGEIVGDITQVSQQLGLTLGELVRAVTTTQTAFPVRENLEAEAKILVPVETPFRNMLPRSIGAGLASQWRQATALGGGWGTLVDQPGGGSVLRSFFSESISGSQAPTERTTTYANKSVGYKLLGVFGSVTGLAIAAGANFQNQLAVEKTNSLRNMMLNEEMALINSVASGSDAFGNASTVAPWGDGANALGFDGLWANIGNGSPAAQIQTNVGALTLSHIDNQLRRIWIQGGQGQYLLLNGQEILSLVHLAEASGSIIRVQASTQADAVLGVAVTGYKHPITGEIVPIYASRFVPAGTMIFGSKFLPDGTPAADVNVLPQVQLPELAPNQAIQGYTAQELAPTTTAPQVYPSTMGGTIH